MMVGDIEILHPEISQPKMIYIKADIVTLPTQLQLPMYDLIIEVSTFSKMSVKLDFTDNSLVLDNVKLPS